MVTVKISAIGNGQDTHTTMQEFTAEQWDRLNDENISKSGWTGEIGLDGSRVLVFSNGTGFVLVLAEVR